MPDIGVSIAGPFRIALAQINPVVGDLAGNQELSQLAIEQARKKGASLVALPELALTGYPPEDLLLKASFVGDNLRCLEHLAKLTTEIVAVVGFVDRVGDSLHNAAAVLADGDIKAIYHKHHLPNYGVFDERRYFQPGKDLTLIRLNDVVIGVSICEDLWLDEGPQVQYGELGADLIVHINASPFHMGKAKQRFDLLSKRAREHHIDIASVNMVGGQDELVFDGGSLAVGAGGDLLARGPQFRDDIVIVDFQPGGKDEEGPPEKSQESITIELPSFKSFERPLESEANRTTEQLPDEAQAYAALVLGVGDYLRKNNFSQCLVGISGGIDSALTAAIACDALGPSNVMGIFNPGEYTSVRSLEDSEALCRNLGIQLVNLPIQPAFQAMLKSLEPVFSGAPEDVTEENLQARIRGTLWMAISNKTGRMVLATGNKSEMSVGYATLYGDMAGGFAVLKDVPKTLVYRLARWRNSEREVIPPSIIDRPPSAELRNDQLDTDSLPPYDVLDPILEAYIEQDLSAEQITEQGFDPDVVRRVMKMVDRAEYKRRQAPPGIKITDRAFGRDRRLPITNQYRPY